MSERIDVALLGPVEVRVDGEAVPITSLSQRVLVARLAMSPDRAVSVPELVNSLWVNDPPANANGNLQSYVSRLRRVVGVDRITSDAAGYRLRIGPNEVDIGRVERLAAEGRATAATDPVHGAGLLAEALAIWRGEPLADLPETLAFTPTLVRLGEWRRQLQEEWFELRLRAGEAAAATDRRAAARAR